MAGLEAGTFRGVIVDHAVSTTKKGLPQFIIQILPKQAYDFEEGAWFDIEETKPAMGFLVLCTEKAEIFHLAAIRDTLGWAGTTFKSLAEANFKDMPVQFGMDENTFEGKTRIQMTGIRAYDAVPGGSCRAASDDDIKGLDEKFGGFLRNSAPKAPTKKTAPKPPAPPKAAAPTPTPVAEPATPSEVTGETAAPAPAVAKTPPKLPPKAPMLVQSEPDSGADAAPPELSAAGATVRNLEECWAAIVEFGDKCNAELGNVQVWWGDMCVQYGDDWESIRKEVCKEIAKTYNYKGDDIPF